MGCKLKRCSVCWIRRQLIGVAVLALGAYWISNDVALQQTCTMFAFAAVIFILLVHHEED